MDTQSHPQLTAIRAALASAGPGSSEILIGIVDGIPDLSPPCLRKAAIEIMDTMVPTDAGGADDHGTGICSLIFGSEAPIFGLAPGCSGLVLPLFLRKGTDPAIRPVSQLDLARAITFAHERGVSIINISAGQKSATTEPEAHLEQALRHCAERRVLLTAAAGNQGCTCINLPSGVEMALAVGALDKRGQPLEVSNWAEPYRQNGLLAPGDDLPVAVPGGNVSSASGTSFATAVVTGVAALLLSVAIALTRLMFARSSSKARHHANWTVMAPAIATSPGRWMPHPHWRCCIVPVPRTVHSLRFNPTNSRNQGGGRSQCRLQVLAS
jgi:subtilisin family serine protease